MSELDTVLITIAASLVTGGIALIGVGITNKENTKRLNLQLTHSTNESNSTIKRKKAEELYELTDTWLKGLFYNYMNLALVMKGKFDYGQYLDQMIKHGKKSKGNFTRLEMIIHVYFQELLPAYNKVLEQREITNKIITEHKHAYEGGDLDGKRFLNGFTAEQLKLEESCETLKMGIAECARNA